MKQTLLSFLLALLPIVACADAVEIDGIYYNLITKGKVAEVTFGNYSGDVIIPETVEYDGTTYDVKQIQEGAFCDSRNMTSILIPSSITSIGSGAFSDCDGLTSVLITDLKAWCNIKFKDSTSSPFNLFASHLFLNGVEIKDLIIPNDVEYINDYAFYGCNGILSATIPNSVTSIGNYAFGYCGGLTSVNLSNNVTRIGSHAFEECISLTSVSFPQSIKSIGVVAFKGCNALTSVHITDIEAWLNISFGDNFSNPLSYAHHLYINGSMIKEIVIPNNMTSINNYVFEGCTDITSVAIPNGIVRIGESAFNGCEGISDIFIPQTVTSINYGAFYGCKGLYSVNIPNSVTSIGGAAFADCSNVTTFVIGSGVEYFGDGVFANCPGITDVYNYSGIPHFSDYLFDGSYIELATLHVPEAAIESYRNTAPWSNFGTIVGLTDTNNFYEIAVTVNSALGTVTYGESSLTDGSQTYNVKDGTDFALTLTPNEGYNLASVTVDGVDKTVDVVDGVLTLTDVNADIVITVSFGKVISSNVVEIDGIYYKLISKLNTAEVTQNPNKYSGDITIPENVIYEGIKYEVTSIGDFAFDDNNKLNSVNIPKSVTTLGNRAFYGCKNLSFLNIPNSVHSIGYMAFAYCNSLSVVNIPNSTTSINERTFFHCISLISISIPNTVTSIGEGVFGECVGLSTIVIPNSVTNIGNYAFSDCTGLTSVLISNSLNTIGFQAFRGCTSLTSVTVPNSVVILGEGGGGVFLGCSNLNTISIGSGVSYIYGQSFANCPEIKDVYCYAENVPNTNVDVFEGSFIDFATLHVPESAIEQYKTTAPWNGFKSIVGVTDTNNYWEMSLVVNNAHGAVFFGEQSVSDGEQTFNVKEGSDVVLTLTPEEDYRLASVKVNGVDKTADVVDGVLTISNVTADLTVNVSFITAGETAAVIIGEAGMATYCSTKDLDFSEVDGLSAYTGAGFNRETGVLTMLKVTDAPAGTGLIVKGSEGTYEIPVKTSASVYGNLLVGVTEETTLSQTAGGYVNYILANGSHGLGFYVVEGEGQLAAGKAYLRLPAAVAGESRAIGITFADDATGIEGISGVCKITTDEWFDLQGRRIAKPSKAGIYLNNGHKIVVR